MFNRLYCGEIVRKFSIERANQIDKDTAEADYFEVREIGTFFHKFVDGMAQSVAFYPLRDIESITEIPTGTTPE